MGETGLTFINGHVHPAQAFLLQSVHVLGEGVPGLLARLDEGLVEGVVGLPSGHMQGSASTPISATATKQQAKSRLTFKMLYVHGIAMTERIKYWRKNVYKKNTSGKIIWMSAITSFQRKLI